MEEEKQKLFVPVNSDDLDLNALKSWKFWPPENPKFVEEKVCFHVRL